MFNDNDVKKAKDKLVGVRSKLILKNVFFGQLAMKLGLHFSDQTETMATDGRKIYFSPLFVDATSTEHLLGVICHEVLHVIFLHPLRRGKRNPKKWNIACDLAINPIIERHGFELPEGSLNSFSFHGWSAEKIYKYLEDEDEWDNFPDEDPHGEGEESDEESDSDSDSDSGSGDSDSDSDSEEDKKDGSGQGQSEEEPKGKPKGFSKVGEVWDATSKDGGALDEAEAKKLERIISRDLLTARQTQANIGHGSLGAEIDARIEDISKAEEIDWRTLLRRHIVDATLNKDDYTWSRPNRRFIGEGTYFPSQQGSGCGEIVIAIDTSGSTFGYESVFAHEINVILAEVKPTLVRVLYCDDEVTKVEEFEQDVEFTYQARGGGGTSFAPPFEWVEKFNWQPECLIYLTDGFGRPPKEAPDYPVIWASCGTTEFVDWGEVIGIDS